MSEYKRIETTPEVWAVIRARHASVMVVFSTYSDPQGEHNGNTSGRMETAWGFPGASVPTLYAKTTWDIDPEFSYKRGNEKHEYWLCVATGEQA